MLARWALPVLLLLTLRGCVAYEYEHEFWLRTDGSGSVSVTGRPELWVAFKGLGRAEDPEGTATRDAARALFERSGLSVNRVTITHRGGRPYLFVSADFRDVNRISYTPAFPDLRVGLRREGGRLMLDGSWQRPIEALGEGDGERQRRRQFGWLHGSGLCVEHVQPAVRRADDEIARVR